MNKSDFILLNFFNSNMDHKNNWMGNIETIAAKTKLSYRTVRRSIKNLKTNEFLLVTGSTFGTKNYKLKNVPWTIAGHSAGLLVSNLAASQQATAAGPAGLSKEGQVVPPPNTTSTKEREVDLEKKTDEDQTGEETVADLVPTMSAKNIVPFSLSFGPDSFSNSKSLNQIAKDNMSELYLKSVRKQSYGTN